MLGVCLTVGAIVALTAVVVFLSKNRERTSGWLVITIIAVPGVLLGFYGLGYVGERIPQFAGFHVSVYLAAAGAITIVITSAVLVISNKTELLGDRRLWMFLSIVPIVAAFLALCRYLFGPYWARYQGDPFTFPLLSAQIAFVGTILGLTLYLGVYIFRRFTVATATLVAAVVMFLGGIACVVTTLGDPGFRNIDVFAEPQLLGETAFWFAALGLLLLETGAAFSAAGLVARRVPTPEMSHISPRTPRREYVWHYGGWRWRWTVYIAEDLYDYYRKRSRPATEDYSVYVAHPGDDEFIRLMLEALKQGAKYAGFDRKRTAEFAIRFVQSLPYSRDIDTTPYGEYPRYPIETLADYGGDCEDKSVLLAAILLALKFDVVLIGVKEPDHIAVGVSIDGPCGWLWADPATHYYRHGGKGYYFLESTNPMWRVGQIPQEYRGQVPRIYEIADLVDLVSSKSREPCPKCLGSGVCPTCKGAG